MTPELYVWEVKIWGYKTGYRTGVRVVAPPSACLDEIAGTGRLALMESWMDHDANAEIVSVVRCEEWYVAHPSLSETRPEVVNPEKKLVGGESGG